MLKSCPPGYAFHNTSADSKVFSSIYQQCTICSPSFFCLGGTSEALACPTGTYSYAGAGDSSFCIVVSFVTLSLTMATTRSDFTLQRQDEFKVVLANISGTTVDHIVIASIIGSRRTATNPSITVIANIATDSDTAAAALVSHFDSSALVTGLSSAGFPSVSLQSIKVLEKSSQGGQDIKMIAAVAASLIAAAVLVAISLIVWRIQNAPASRRLLSAKYGQQADQRDLPKELRNKYEAVQAVGSGAYGVVLEAWQLSSGKRTVRRAIKLVHARARKFTAQELRRLDREVLLWSRCTNYDILESC